MASNAYGFDFLKTEHTLSQQEKDELQRQQQLAAAGGAAAALIGATGDASTGAMMDVSHKPDLEKQADILKFLRLHRAAGHLGAETIFKGTGIDLEGSDESVGNLLANNKKIEIELVPDPENPSVMVATYAYISEYKNVRDRDTLLAQVNKAPYGINMKSLTDCYDGVEDDIKSLICGGEIIGVANSEDKTTILFRRGGTFLVEMDGIISLPSTTSTPSSSAKDSSDSKKTNGTNKSDISSSSSGGKGMTDDEVVQAAIERNRKRSSIVHVETDVNPTKQIRRGEAVKVGGQWFRVSSAVKAGVPLEDQPARAQAPLTVTSLQDLSKRNEVDGYIRPFSRKVLPLDRPLSTEAKKHVMKAKEARHKLAKLAGNRSHSGGAGQLMSSHAHSSNPATLAQNFATTMMGGGRNKRPTAHHKMFLSSASSSASSASAMTQQLRKDARAAQEAASDPHISNFSLALRHGCTKDVRDMYLATRDLVPRNDEVAMQQLLIQHNLLQPNEQWRRKKLKKKSNVDDKGKPRKKRYYERKNQRLTNIHLVGTEIGMLLNAAQQKQAQGKSVGDGGM